MVLEINENIFKEKKIVINIFKFLYKFSLVIFGLYIWYYYYNMLM